MSTVHARLNLPLYEILMDGLHVKEEWIMGRKQIMRSHEVLYPAEITGSRSAMMKSLMKRQDMERRIKLNLDSSDLHLKAG